MTRKSEFRFHLLLCVSLTLLVQNAWSSDACARTAILTSAEVTVSDGSSFATQSFFHSRDAAAIRHLRDDAQTVAVEGPLGWMHAAGKYDTGKDFYKTFALGHQYHAFLLDFDNIVDNPRQTRAIEFDGSMRSASSGDYPFGGTVHLVEGKAPDRPLGLLFEFPQTPPISAAFHDWREVSGTVLPHRIDIFDGDRTFEYRYSEIAFANRSPLWFFEAVDPPGIDAVQIYRLHRKLLAAHCLGDEKLMSGLSAPEVLSASRGELTQYSNADVGKRFAGLFQRLDYVEYHDLVAPIIEVAESAETGWIGVNVRARGSDRESGARFDDQWAWIMAVRKIDGAWLNAGNASNRRQ